MANPYDQFDTAPSGVFVPAPGAPEREAREQRGEARDETRIGISQTSEARQETEGKRNAIKQLSDAFNAQKPVQDYQTALPAYATIVELAAKPASKANDFTIITMYNKLQDPGSAVLEGERRSAQDVGTLLDKYSTILKGQFDPETGFVSDTARKQFIQAAETLIEERRRAYDFMRRRYSDVAQSDTYKVDPALVVGPDFSADYDPVILENWNKLFPPQAQAALQVADGDRYSTPQEIDIARQMQEAWNGGASAEQMNALAQQLTGKSFTPEQMEDLKGLEGKTVTWAPTKTGVRETGAQISEGLGGDIQSAAMGSVTGFLANMPEELAGTVGMDPRQVQAAREAYQEANPVASFGGEVLGGVLSPVAKLGGAIAGPVAGRVAGPVASMATRGAIEGGVYGGVYGAGEAAPGAPMQERLTGAGIGALTGALGGAGGGALAGRASRGAPEVPLTPEPAPPVGTIPGAIDTGVPGAIEAAATPLAVADAEAVATLARKAVSRSPGAAQAKNELARMATVNPEARAAAERLGVELPPDILSDNSQLKSLVGLTRSQVGTEAEEAWKETTRQMIQRADGALEELGGQRDLASLSETVSQRMNAAMTDLEGQASVLRREVDDAIDVRDAVDATNLQRVLSDTINDLGGIDEAKAAFSGEEKKLLAMLGEGETAKRPTYARLNKLRDQIGEALFKGKGPWADTDQKALAKYYAALADDQLGYIEQIGGTELAEKMRGSNTLFKQMFDKRREMQTLFGEQLQKDLGPKILASIEQGKKGNAEAMRTLMERIPEDMRKEVLMSGLLSHAQGKGGMGGFSFPNFAKTYRGLRQNAPIYKQIADAVGPEGHQLLTDLYAISTRMVDAESRVLKTGKANQAMLSALNMENLVARVAKATTARSAGAMAGATVGSVGGVPGAAAGAAIGNTIQDTVAGALSKDRAAALHKLLSSPEFKAIAEDGSEKAITKLAGSKSFTEWAKGKIPGDFKDRRKWIVAALVPAAANLSPETPSIEVPQ